MEIPERNSWNPTNLLLFFGAIVAIGAFIFMLFFSGLWSEDQKETEPKSKATETVITESVITPLYSSDPFNFDDKSLAEAKDMHSQLKLLSYSYKSLPHADEFAIKTKIDSVMRVAEERFSILP